VAANDTLAGLLNIPPGSPLLHVVTSTYLEGDELIELTASYYRADRYEYSTSQTRCEE
jgi:DNA-binding GntR family transcriptional regulator